MENWDFEEGGDFECPPDQPDCMDAWYYEFDEFYYGDMYYDMEPPTYEEIAALFEEYAFEGVTFDDRAYEYLMNNMDSEPGTPEFDEQFGGFLDMIGANTEQGEVIMEVMMMMMEGGHDHEDMTQDDLAMWLMDEYSLTLTDDGWNAFQAVDSEPGTPEFDEQTGAFCNWIGAGSD
jgi:hypothetical protein